MIVAYRRKIQSGVTSVCNNSPIPLDQNTWNYSAESKLNFLHSHTLHISNNALSPQGQLGHVARAYDDLLHSTFILAVLIGWLQRLLDTKCY